MQICFKKIVGKLDPNGLSPNLDWQLRFIRENVRWVIQALGGCKSHLEFCATNRPLSEYGSPNFKLGTVCLGDSTSPKQARFIFRPTVFGHECDALKIEGSVCSTESLAVLWHTLGFLLRLYVQKTQPSRIKLHPFDFAQNCGRAVDPITQRMTSSCTLTSCGLVNGTLKSYIDAVGVGSLLVNQVFVDAVDGRKITPERIANCVLM